MLRTLKLCLLLTAALAAPAAAMVGGAREDAAAAIGPGEDALGGELEGLEHGREPVEAFAEEPPGVADEGVAAVHRLGVAVGRLVEEQAAVDESLAELEKLRGDHRGGDGAPPEALDEQRRQRQEAGGGGGGRVLSNVPPVRSFLPAEGTSVLS